MLIVQDVLLNYACYWTYVIHFSVKTEVPRIPTILIWVPHIPESMASTGSYRYFDDEDEDDLEGIL